MIVKRAPFTNAANITILHCYAVIKMGWHIQHVIFSAVTRISAYLRSDQACTGKFGVCKIHLEGVRENLECEREI